MQLSVSFLPLALALSTVLKVTAGEVSAVLSFPVYRVLTPSVHFE